LSYAGCSDVRGDLGFVQVLVDHAGADVGDFGALREPVDNERVQILVVSHGDVYEEILSPRDDEDADGLGQLGGPVAESFNVAPRRRADADGDECLNAPADRGEVEVKDGPADDATFAQAPGPFQRGGRGNPDGGGAVVVDMPRIAQANRVYDDYLAELAETKPEDLAASAVSIIGPRNKISKLVRNLSLLR